jgi:putative DNA primase/helicase
VTEKVTGTSGAMSYELRCWTRTGNSDQDVLPPSIHPETKQPYYWVKGGLESIPQIPMGLLQYWLDLNARDTGSKATTSASKASNDSNADPCTDQDWAMALDALPHIDACDRETWRNVGMALAGTGRGGAFEVWCTWSATAWGRMDVRKIPTERDMAQQWSSFKNRDGGIKLGTLFKLALGAGWVRPAPSVEGMFPVVEQQHETNLDLLELASQQKGQDAAAVVFAERQRGQLVYVAELRTWYVRGEFAWMPDKVDVVRDLVRKTVRALNPQAKAAMGSANFANGVLTFAAADPVFARSQTQFDADNYLLNTPGETVDLRSGKRWPNRPDDLLMKCTAVAPTDDPAPVFNRFMSEITQGDTELQNFLQVALGACLSGGVEAHWLMFWIGNGRNGKNTLGDLIEWIMGNYAVKIPAATLMQQRNEGHPTELATLRGVRLATSSEVQDGAHWHESRINELTGDATISARVMRGDFFTFQRSHKHIVYGNHRPQIRATTQAVRQRLKIVPFRASFVGREDPNLPEKLRVEGGAVLTWLIDGHARWLALGKRLPKCQAVEAESADYFESQGSIDAWLTERCLADPEARSTTATLYANFSEWKRARGEVAESQTRFAESLSSRFEKFRSKASRGFIGIRLGQHPIFTPID